MRAVMAGVAVVVIVAGVIFTLQGVGVIGGSFMSGSALWAALGPLIALSGFGLLAVSRNR
ncbi:MAG TPA: hypothetical protein VH274_07880 [Mycobacteriales bacterium]|nr:hypothetical protein [Mycobacteriales bacterium]